jgi:predicted TIM-barrel fold metal-dependent hydrolase
LINDMLVVDAVVHPYNLSPENLMPGGQELSDLIYRSHLKYSGDYTDYALKPEEFFVEFDVRALDAAIFRESPADMAIIHTLPNLGFQRGPMTSPETSAELRALRPERYLVYAAIDTLDPDEAVRQLERQVAELGAVGLKLYPTYLYDGASRAWRLGDDFSRTLFEAARALGIRNVAIHKGAASFPPSAPHEPFTLADVHEGPARFPDMTFQIVHAGTAFLEETRTLLEQHPNLYATIETTTSFVMTDERAFAEGLGILLQAGAEDRILFASGVNLIHPLPPMELFSTFEMPADLVEAGYPRITDEIRRKVFGENALRLHGLDPADVRARLAGLGDDVEAERTDGLAPPWSHLRERSVA